jgi:hypothetical protein
MQIKYKTKKGPTVTAINSHTLYALTVEILIKGLIANDYLKNTGFELLS